jgi:hypothetical protein
MAELNETNDIYGLDYEWKLTGLRKVNTSGLDGVVIGTNWKLTGIDADGFSGSFTGATPFKVENMNTASFTQFNDLNENTVLSWIQGEVFKHPSYWEHINTQVLKFIRDNKSPVETIFENDLPWSPLSGSVTAPTMQPASEPSGPYSPPDPAG